MGSNCFMVKVKSLLTFQMKGKQGIEAPIEGRIDHWYVNEGSTVKKGEPIVELIDIDPNIIIRLEAEKNALDLKLQATEKAIFTSNKNIIRQKSLFEKGLSSERSLELAQLEYTKFLSEKASAMAEITRMETKLARQTSQLITSPRDGTIMNVTASQGGALVKSGDVLAILVPDSEQKVVELKISGNDLPLVSVGRPVRLQFEGWPAVQFSGWPSVAVGTFGGKVAFIDPSDDGTGNFRVLVFPDGNDQWPDKKYLRQGVRTMGWVLLDSVRLGWEMWRRFNAFPPTVTESPKADISKSK